MVMKTAQSGPIGLVTNGSASRIRSRSMQLEQGSLVSVPGAYFLCVITLGRFVGLFLLTDHAASGRSNRQYASWFAFERDGLGRFGTGTVYYILSTSFALIMFSHECLVMPKKILDDMLSSGTAPQRHCRWSKAASYRRPIRLNSKAALGTSRIFSGVQPLCLSERQNSDPVWPSDDHSV